MFIEVVDIYHFEINQMPTDCCMLYDMKLNIYEFDFVLHPNFLETFESVISVSLKELSC